LEIIRLEKVVALFGKVDRRLESRHQIEEGICNRTDHPSQRALKLIKGDTRLQRRDRIDQIGHRLRLRQIDASIQKCSQGELARLGESSTLIDGLRHNGPKDDSASVRAQLNGVFTGIRPWRGEKRHDDVIDWRLIDGNTRERGLAWTKGRGVCRQS